MIENGKVTFEAAYGRQGEMEVLKNEWTKCINCQSEDNPVLFADSSEGEYGGCMICLDCIGKLFAFYDASQRNEAAR